MLFRQVALCLLATGASAFVASPFGGFPVSQVAKPVLFSDATEGSDVTGVADAVDSPAASDEPSIVSEDTASAAKEDEGFTAFVKNLPFSVTSNELDGLFSEHGEVISISLPVHRDSGQARGFGFVTMKTREALESSISSVNGIELDGRSISVAESLPKEQLKSAPRKPMDNSGGKMYIGNIPFDASSEHLKEYFSEFGEVTDIYVPMNPDGTPRGFAFVTMGEEDVEKTIEGTNGQEFMGRNLVVSRPLPPGERAQKREGSGRTKIYIGNLSFYTTADTLIEVFEEFGTVHDCYLPEDPSTGSMRGFGFISMDPQNAESAIADLDGCELDGRVIRVNQAQPKGNSRPRNDRYNDGYGDE